MPEYLAPGVYVEEVSFRSKSIEGVPTSTTGFAGLTRYGPVQYGGGPSTTEPRLITSYTEFERVYGGLAQLFIDRGDGHGFRVVGLALARFAEPLRENGEGIVGHAARPSRSPAQGREGASGVRAKGMAQAGPPDTPCRARAVRSILAALTAPLPR